MPFNFNMVLETLARKVERGSLVNEIEHSDLANDRILDDLDSFMDLFNMYSHVDNKIAANSYIFR